MDFCAEGCACTAFRMPFYIFPPGASGEKGSEIGKIVKVWGCLSSALEGANRLEVEFPAGADPNAKARLLAGVFLINQLVLPFDSHPHLI